MDRQTVYPGQIPLETDLLNTNRNVLTAIGALVQDIFGTNTVFTGLSVVPTVPASMSVNVNPGRCFSLQVLDNTPYSSLPANQTLQIMKQGILSTAQTFALTAPVTAGYSVNYLISAAFLETDTGATVLPYYNAAQPSVAWSGPGGNGATNTTVRQDTVALTLTAGVPATTGTQTTPATPAGTSALYVVTVAYGQATVTAPNISAVTGAQILPGSLMAIGQQALSTSAMDTGAANAYAATYTPAIQALSNNMTLVFEAKNANTGASTFSPNGLTAYPILGGDHNALTGGEIVAGGKYEVIWKASANAWILLGSTGGYSKIITAPQFDNSTKGASTAFVRANGIQSSGVTAYNANTSLSAANIGGTVYAYGSVALTFSVPNANGLPAGAHLEIINASSQPLTVGVTAGVGPNTINIGSNTTTALVVQPSDSLILLPNVNGSWFAVSGAAMLQYSASFGYSAGTSGYQKLPSGLIIQWGTGTSNASADVAVTFPIAFPNNCFTIGFAPTSITSTPGVPGTNAITRTGFNLNGWNVSSARTALTATYIAIGN